MHAQPLQWDSPAHLFATPLLCHLFHGLPRRISQVPTNCPDAAPAMCGWPRIAALQVLEAGGAASPDASGVRNDSPGTIRGLVYELSPWSGGFVLPGQTATSIPGQLIQGAFAKLTATISVASDTNPGLLKLAGSPSSTIPIGPKGVSSGSIHSAGAFLNPTGSVAAALSGCCQWTQDSGAAIPGVSLNTAPVYDQARRWGGPVPSPMAGRQGPLGIGRGGREGRQCGRVGPQRSVSRVGPLRPVGQQAVGHPACLPPSPAGQGACAGAAEAEGRADSPWALPWAGLHAGPPPPCRAPAIHPHRQLSALHQPSL